MENYSPANPLGSSAQPNKTGTIWPYMIIASFVAFGLFIGTFVFKMMRSDAGLVSKQYYDDELAYQSRMESISRAIALNDSVQIIQSSDSIQLLVPKQLLGCTGEIEFFRPADDSKDFTIEISPAASVYAVRREGLVKGLWIVKTHCYKNGYAYYFEKRMII